MSIDLMYIILKLYVICNIRIDKSADYMCMILQMTSYIMSADISCKTESLSRMGSDMIVWTLCMTLEKNQKYI